VRTLVKTGTAVAACVALGTAASREVDSLWYAALRKPAIQPPAVAFPVVWTALYADLVITSAAAVDALEGQERAEYVRAFAVNLVLNAGWSWVAFKAHRLGWAVPAAAVLAASSVDLVRRTWRAERRGGLALAPYPAWCSFATVLSAALWRANRG
jgi:benzodiazapine receptor